MNKSLLVIIVLAGAAVLYFKFFQKTPEPIMVTNSPTLMAKKDRTGMSVAGFANANLIHHFGKNKDEYSCLIIGEPEEYILKNLNPLFEERLLNQNDKAMNIDFEVLVSIQCHSHRVKRVHTNPKTTEDGLWVTTEDGSNVMTKTSQWSDWAQGTPHALRGHLFRIQRIRGKYLWVPIKKITPM